MNLFLLFALVACALAGDKKGLSQSQKDAILAAHNKCRDEAKASYGYNIGQLQWNDKLAAFAQDYLDKQTVSDLQEVEHSAPKGKPQCSVPGFECQAAGENLAAGNGWSSNAKTQADAEKAMTEAMETAMYGNKGWCNERENFDQSSKQCRGVCGHWSQVVWDKTTQVGCGGRIKWSGGSHNYVVMCSYNPGGNSEGNDLNPYKPDRQDIGGKFGMCAYNRKDICSSSGSNGGGAPEEPSQPTGTGNQKPMTFPTSNGGMGDFDFENFGGGFKDLKNFENFANFGGGGGTTTITVNGKTWSGPASEAAANRERLMKEAGLA